MDNKEVKLNSSNIRLISLSPSNIDDLFIYKHKIEEDIAKASEQPIERMSLDEFKNDNIVERLIKCPQNEYISLNCSEANKLALVLIMVTSQDNRGSPS